MKAILFALFAALLMVGRAASSSKDGKKVDSNHTSSGQGLSDLDLSDIDLGEDSDGEDPLGKIEEKINELSLRTTDQISHNQSLRDFRLASGLFASLAEAIRDTNNTMQKYRKKASDPNTSLKQRLRYEALAESLASHVEELGSNMPQAEEIKHLTKCLDELDFGDEMVEAFVWYTIIPFLEFRFYDDGVTEIFGEESESSRKRANLNLSRQQKITAQTFLVCLFQEMGEPNLFLSNPVLETNLSPKEIEKLATHLTEPLSETQIKATRDLAKLIQKRIEANKKD